MVTQPRKGAIGDEVSGDAIGDAIGDANAIADANAKLPVTRRDEEGSLPSPPPAPPPLMSQRSFMELIIAAKVHESVGRLRSTDVGLAESLIRDVVLAISQNATSDVAPHLHMRVRGIMKRSSVRRVTGGR